MRPDPPRDRGHDLGTTTARSSRSASRSLAGGIAEIRVGAQTETEMKERKALVEDALHATRAAIEEGILPGGGTALLRASQVLDDEFCKKNKLKGDQAFGERHAARAITRCRSARSPRTLASTAPSSHAACCRTRA